MCPSVEALFHLVVNAVMTVCRPVSLQTNREIPQGRRCVLAERSPIRLHVSFGKRAKTISGSG